MTYWKCEVCENINKTPLWGKPKCRKCGKQKEELKEQAEPNKLEELLGVVFENQAVLDQKMDRILELVTEEEGGESVPVAPTDIKRKK